MRWTRTSFTEVLRKEFCYFIVGKENAVSLNIIVRVLKDDEKQEVYWAHPSISMLTAPGGTDALINGYGHSAEEAVQSYLDEFERTLKSYGDDYEFSARDFFAAGSSPDAEEDPSR